MLVNHDCLLTRVSCEGLTQSIDKACLGGQQTFSQICWRAVAFWRLRVITGRVDRRQRTNQHIFQLHTGARLPSRISINFTWRCISERTAESIRSLSSN